jgi:PIN domain nuclease of toxin-antitoxin system
VKLLLDSHVLLWWEAKDKRLGKGVAGAIATASEVFVSAASVWELLIKRSLGKLELAGSLSDAIEAAGFEHLSITAKHAEEAANLPLLHRDPFDRMLVAQARLEVCTLVTNDERLARYQVPVLMV